MLKKIPDCLLLLFCRDRNRYVHDSVFRNVVAGDALGKEDNIFAESPRTQQERKIEIIKFDLRSITKTEAIEISIFNRFKYNRRHTNFFRSF